MDEAAQAVEILTLDLSLVSLFFISSCHRNSHGELLPAFGYPKIREAYPHLVGNYGGAWQAQKVEFARFPVGLEASLSNLSVHTYVYPFETLHRTSVGRCNSKGGNSSWHIAAPSVFPALALSFPSRAPSW
jgi:hypothetical protein